MLGRNHLNFGYESSGYETSMGTKRPVSLASSEQLSPGVCPLHVLKLTFYAFFLGRSETKMPNLVLKIYWSDAVKTKSL